MKDVRRPNLAATRRLPKTQRGAATRDEILSAARELLSERWLDDVPFTELAASAGVARASLLHVYPHWRNVLWDLFEEQLALVTEAFEAASTLKRARPGDKAYAMLVPLLDRAEKTGRLYPNLRGAMFTWHGETTYEDAMATSPRAPLTREQLGAWKLMFLYDLSVMVEELLGSVPPDQPEQRNQFFEFIPVPIGQCLVNFAFDLAAGSETPVGNFGERRRALRSSIDFFAAGIRTSKPLRAGKRRAKLRDS